MTILNDRVRPHSQVVDTKLDDGEVVLLHLDSKNYFSLNLTGERIWRGLKQGLSLGEISTRLQAEFNVAPADADASVGELVEELLAQKLVQPVD